MKRYALLLTLIFVCSLAPIQLGTVEVPESLNGSQAEIDAAFASGRNNNPPTIDSFVLHNTEPLFFGQADPINMTVEASDLEDINTEFFNYTWSNAGNELPGCGGSGAEGANCLLPILSTYVTAFPVSVSVTDSEGASVSTELMLTIWNNAVSTATSDSEISVSYSIRYYAPTAFTISATDVALNSYENVELPGYTGTYNAVAAVEYVPGTTFSANDVLDHSLDVSVAKSLGATSLWYVSEGGVWGLLSANANEVDASTEQFSFAFPENSPVLSAGTLVLIGDSMSPIAPPDATISGLTAYQSSDNGDITASWQVSGTFLSSDAIQVTICKDNLNCENAFSTTLAIGDVNFVYSGSNTWDGLTHYITVEICNEASCSIPAQASVLVEKGTPLHEQCVTHAALAVHDHLTLEFELQGEVFQTPANMGIDTSVCVGEMHVIHTHALDDVLHLELHEVVPVYLSLFFEIWNISYPQSTELDMLFLMPENVSIYVGDVLYGGTFDTLQLTNGQSIKVIFYSNTPDSDGDGVNDDVDQFPNDANESVDSAFLEIRSKSSACFNAFSSNFTSSPSKIFA
ncbi:hypothetical protein OAC38_04465 [Candidatus Poseidoniaceae archaeon]|nr:hypothetical protein [Candidatus Poseidoniaceae archaeon]